MNIPNPKDLKKLADACRKAGIKTFKSSEFEFTLSDDAPVSNYKKAKSPSPSSPDQPFQSDSLSPEQLLNWSVMDMPMDSES